MERQDAIYWITNLIGRYGKEYDEALEMAESALRQSKLIEDAVSRQQVIDTIISETYYPCYFAEKIRKLPAAQPELTDEQSIAHLQSSGWMQRHDKEMYESGLKEQLADDSDSYDSLLPTVHPKIILCVDCKHWKNEHLCESLSRFGSLETKADFYCGYAERKINERTG